MRFSRNWIATYTDLPDGRRELSTALSMLGLVVDDMRDAGDDVILDLDLPSNRPDVMNHFEIAREASIAAGTELRVPPSTVHADGEPTSSVAQVVVDDPQACQRFVARAIVDVTVGPSPTWLCERLESIGLRPINNVVDVTNFVMWELGRPMHAYDLDKLEDGMLRVRNAAPGERLETLDEVQRELDSEDLVIADATHAIGLAGLMGGAGTGVTESTRRVLLECACFDAGRVRRMARRHGMHTDASHRFERGMSHQGIEAAVQRAAHLLTQLCGGTVSERGIDVRGTIPAPVQLQLPASRLRGYLGVEVPAERVAAILTGLQFGVEPGDDCYTVEVPPRRVDVRLEVDVIEEIARFHGYDELPDTLPLLRRRDGAGLSTELRDEAKIRRLCAAQGYWEALTFVFTSAAEQAPFLEPGKGSVALANPLSTAMGVLRNHLTPGLLACVARNLNQGRNRVRLFEIGRAFTAGDAGEAPIERRHVALVACGASEPAHYAASDRAYGFADLRRELDTLAQRMHWPRWDWQTDAVHGLQPGLSALLVHDGETRGFAGKLASDAAAQLGVDSAVWVAEIDIHHLVGRAEPPLRVRALPRYPASARDVSVSVPTSVPFARIERAAASLDAIPLVGVELIDVYRGEDLEPGAVGLTLRLTYRSGERTLTAEEIEAAHEAVVAELQKSCSAQRR